MQQYKDWDGEEWGTPVLINKYVCSSELGYEHNTETLETKPTAPSLEAIADYITRVWSPESQGPCTIEIIRDKYLIKDK